MSSLSGGTSLVGGYTRLCKGLPVVLIGGRFLVQILRVVASTIGLLLTGKLLEPVWGSMEFLKFIFIVNLFTSLCVFVTAIILCYTTTMESYFCGSIFPALVLRICLSPVHVIPPRSSLWKFVFLCYLTDPIATILRRLLCGKCKTQLESDDYDVGGNPLPGADPIEVSRRRKHGARAVEERLG